LFTKLQFTRYAQNILHLINKHKDTSDIGLSHTFIGPGAVAIGLTVLKTRWWKDSSFSIANEYTRTLFVTTEKNLRDWFQENLAAVLLNLFSNFFFCEDLNFNIFPSILDSPCTFFCYSYTPCIFFSQRQALLITPTQNSSQIILIFVSAFTSLDSEMQTPYW